MMTKKPQDNAAPETAQKNKKKITFRQAAALIGVALLLILYIATLIVAVADSSSSGKWFWMCLIATMAVPLLIWIYTWMYGKLTQKHTIADFDLNVSEETSGGSAAEDSDAHNV